MAISLVSLSHSVKVPKGPYIFLTCTLLNLTDWTKEGMLPSGSMHIWWNPWCEVNHFNFVLSILPHPRLSILVLDQYIDSKCELLVWKVLLSVLGLCVLLKFLTLVCIVLELRVWWMKKMANHLVWMMQCALSVKWLLFGFKINSDKTKLKSASWTMSMRYACVFVDFVV